MNLQSISFINMTPPISSFKTGIEPQPLWKLPEGVVMSKGVLCKEIFLEILSHLPINDRKSILYVNRSWTELYSSHKRNIIAVGMRTFGNFVAHKKYPIAFQISYENLANEFLLGAKPYYLNTWLCANEFFSKDTPPTFVLDHITFPQFIGTFLSIMSIKEGLSDYEIYPMIAKCILKNRWTYLADQSPIDFHSSINETIAEMNRSFPSELKNVMAKLICTLLMQYYSEQESPDILQFSKAFDVAQFILDSKEKRGTIPSLFHKIIFSNKAQLSKISPHDLVSLAKKLPNESGQYKVQILAKAFQLLKEKNPNEKILIELKTTVISWLKEKLETDTLPSNTLFPVLKTEIINHTDLAILLEEVILQNDIIDRKMFFYTYITVAKDDSGRGLNNIFKKLPVQKITECIDACYHLSFNYPQEALRVKYSLLSTVENEIPLEADVKQKFLDDINRIQCISYR